MHADRAYSNPSINLVQQCIFNADSVFQFLNFQRTIFFFFNKFNQNPYLKSTAIRKANRYFGSVRVVVEYDRTILGAHTNRNNFAKLVF